MDGPAADAPEIFTGVRITRSRRRLATSLARSTVAFGLAPVLLALLATFSTLPNPAFVAVGVLWLAAWLVGVPLSAAASFLASRRAGITGSTLCVDAERLTSVDGAAAFPRSSIVGGLLVHERGEPVAELSLDDGSVVHLAMEDEAAARRLLATLDVERGDRRVAHELGSAWPALGGIAAVLAGVLTTCLATCGVAATASTLPHMLGPMTLVRLLGVVFVAATVVTAARRTPARVVIGTDGVRLEGARGRFIPFSRIVAVAATSDGLDLVLSGPGFGRRVRLTSERGARSDALLAELRSALERSQGEAGDAASAALLDRGARSLPEWREALRRLSAGDGDYRRARISTEVLVRTTSDAAAPPGRRIGAAVALSHSSDDEALRRARIALDGMADERIRIVLDRALAGSLDDPKLEQALAEADAAAESERKAMRG